MDGTPFGRYRLVELLGRGGMGEVWRAHDIDTDRVVAIKLLPAFLSDDEEFKQRFRREAHAAARLNDPHVIPIHNYGEIDGQLYVDMRLIEGKDLQTLLSGGPLEPARAVRIIEQVAKALHAAHEVGLLHRDVKPSNILLGRDDFAYLIDFGIARAIEETRMTKSGDTIGTFQYIAPERLETGVEDDARADIYSLACVLYESLTGQPPFRGSTTAQLFNAHLNTPPPRPSTTQPDVPPAIDEVIATGMAKDPNLRYVTTVELASAAHDAITTPITRPAQNLGTRAAFASSPATPTMSATEAAQQQPDDLNLAVTQQDPADHRPPETPTQPRGSWWPPRGRSGLIAAIIVAVVVLVSGVIIFQLQQPSRPPTPSAAPITQPAPPPPPPPPKLVEQAALDGLLLTPDQINTAMGATGITVTGSSAKMDTDSSRLADKACVYVESGSDAFVYADSGWTAFREQWLSDHPPAGVLKHSVNPAVVLFPSADDALAFFTASTKSWSACANRRYTVTQPGFLDQTWTVGPVTNANGTLSISTTDLDSQPKGWTCQRALTVANNVAIDITACSGNPADSAVNIAHQIAAKVPTA
jgi:serine/threonine kinase PknH